MYFTLRQIEKHPGKDQKFFRMTYDDVSKLSLATKASGYLSHDGDHTTGAYNIHLSDVGRYYLTTVRNRIMLCFVIATLIATLFF